MSAKISEARRRAFLAALGESRNQTLAAERAKVSRAWVQLHRARDPAFGRAVAEALAAARQALALRRGDDAQGDGERAGCRPPGGWGFLGGAELVVRGNGGSRLGGDEAAAANKGRTQIARARLRQWSPRAEERFLGALMSTCNVRAACAEAGLSPASAYNHRGRWPAFARRWDKALEIGHVRLEYGVVEAACNLFSRPDGDLPEPGPLRVASVDQAIRLLALHRRAAGTVGKRPGRAPDDPDPEALRASILRKIEAIERFGRLEQSAPSDATPRSPSLSGGIRRD
jgi:hypothetical protein